MRLNDITGQRFGRLVVSHQAPSSKRGQARWVCICDCGNTTIVESINLRFNGTRSCGCYKKEHAKDFAKTHGMSSTKTYYIYHALRDRCNDIHNKKYMDYGGRGITVCERWMESFENFYADMGEAPIGESIDRIDNSKGYSPDNCRWITHAEQMKNTRANHFVTYNGQTKCLAEWAEELHINRFTLYKRFAKGCSIEELFAQPYHKSNRR